MARAHGPGGRVFKLSWWLAPKGRLQRVPSSNGVGSREGGMEIPTSLVVGAKRARARGGSPYMRKPMYGGDGDSKSVGRLNPRSA